MELAAYALLERVAEAAGDEETARLAREIAAEERAMAERLEGFFDIAVEASVSGSRHDDIETQLVKHLADAHALEQQAKRLLESGPKLVDDEALANLLAEHYEETLLHEKRLEERLQAHDASPSTVKDAALSLGGLNVGGFFGAQPDTTTKLAGFAYAFEHIEIGSYELLKRVALMAGDEETVEVVDRTLAEERAAAERIASAWDRPGVPLGVAS
jgi:ferritin-like metal-binding protein YciE